MKTKASIVLCTLIIILLGLNDQVFSQYYFGRNKIQYNDFQWKILKTEHFDVYFYPEMRELAEIGAAMAEEAYSRLEGKLNHNISRRIPLILYSSHAHFQQTNTIASLVPEGVGGFFEFIKGRVVIPANGSIHQFKHVINHELVHVFSHSKVNRVLKDHRKTNLGNGMPLWFVEGLAEYWSQGWDSQTEMVIRDAVLNGYIVPLSQMDAIYGSFLMYKEGQAICRFISQRFGEEKILQLMENIWKENSFSNVMKLTIGLNYREFDEQWLYDLKKNKYPLLEKGDVPAMVTKVITRNGINTKPACYSKDGRDWVVFVSNRVGYSNIYRKPLNDFTVAPKAEVLIKGERTSEFESFHLLRSKIDVNNEGKLTFVSKSGARDALYVFDIDKKQVVKKLQFDGLVSLFSPSWAPNGRQIAFSGIRFSGLSDLYIVDVASGRLQKLTNDFYDDRDPAWSPDGNLIAFSSDRSYFGKDGYLNLFIHDLRKGTIQNVTQGKFNDYSPAWSPDGQYLAFASDRDGSFNIWMIKNNAQSSNDLQVAENSTMPSANVIGNFGENGSGENAEEPDYSYPCALEETDDLKELTNFATGAFDPEWQDEDNLLFTAFENFSFQLRQETEVGEKFEKAPLAQRDTLTVYKELWSAEKIAGDVETTAIKYKRKFSLDIAQSAVTQDPLFGVSGGAQLAMSDMLGNQQYYFLLFNNSQTSSDFLKSFNFAVTKVDLSKRVNYAYGVYHITGRFYDLVDSFFEERRAGGFFGVSYPISVFKRIEANINIRREKRTYEIGGRRQVNGIVVSNSVSYVKDNSLWGPTGPVDGERFNFSLGHTIDVQHNDVNFFTVIADYRRYYRINTRMTYAVRLLTRFNQGKEAFRYFMGGSWDLRLYPRWRIWGRKLFLVNNELRFPFIDRFALRFPFGGLGFNGIRGATFVDFGQAWDNKYDFNQILGSMGLGLRMRVGGFLVLRYEFGKRFQIRDLNSPKLHFDSGIKKAFWFGFDF
ncbi:MAG: peptidase MA family metallohydrolase [bacterium]